MDRDCSHKAWRIGGTKGAICSEGRQDGASVAGGCDIISLASLQTLERVLFMKADLLKLRIAGIMGFLAVGLGAMGAHALKTKWETTLGVIEAAYRLDLWKTASQYHIVHSVVLLVLAFAYNRPEQGRWASRMVTSGIVLFSGSLYLFSLTKAKWLVAITPIGGVLLMLGWLFLIFSGKKEQV